MFKRCARLAGRWPAKVGPSAGCSTAATVVALGLAVVQTVLAANPPEAQSLRRFSFRQNQMGAPVELVLYSADEPAANKAAEAVWARFRQLNQIMSDYEPTSELSRLSDSAGSGRKVPVSQDLWIVLEAAQRLAARSGGAFDVTVGPYVKLWRRARREKQFPPPQRLEAARKSVGYQFLELDPAGRTALLKRPGMRLDLGGIATGYACDEAMKLLRQLGISRALVDASGDILVGDPPPDQQGWKIGIAPLESRTAEPSRYLLLTNAAVTTAGDAWQFVELGGRRYSHIVDPHTGLGLSTRSSVTVVARDCLTADSLDTAACVLGPEQGIALVEGTPGAAALMLTLDNGKLRTYLSKRFADVATWQAPATSNGPSERRSQR